MSDYKTEHCLIFLSDADFNVLTENPISNDLKVELLKYSLPQGSRWRKYSGSRSISFFPLRTYTGMYALSYAVVTDSIETPTLSFIIMLNRQQSEVILKQRMQGIENAFIRRNEIFASLDEKNAKLLRDNVVFYKALKEPSGISQPLKKTDQNQTIFTATFSSQHQWQIVEEKVVEKSANSLSSFRTLALQKETGFQVLGIVTSTDDKKKQSNSTPATVFTFGLLFFVFLILIVIVLVFLFSKG